MRARLLFACVLAVVPLRAAHGALAQGSEAGAASALADSPAWNQSGRRGIRGVTIGPIENGYHPGVGYGSAAFDRTLDECAGAGGEWIALTPFGRVPDLGGSGVDPTFEAPLADNVTNLRRSVAMAHARGLKVFLVPHLWVESGEWRALIDPKTDAGWKRWSQSYGGFVKRWATVASDAGVEMMSVGVELRSWVTGVHAPSFLDLVGELRSIYKGLLVYSANWDDADDTVIWGALDAVGINAFFPLAEHAGAGARELREGGLRVRDTVRRLSEAWRKPVLFTEIGYTTRPDPALKPWEWPDAMKGVAVDEPAQARAYEGLLGPLIDEPTFLGFFVWRVYADPDDVSQEAEWGFSPRGKLAELVMRDAFHARWASDAPRDPFPPQGLHALVPGTSR